MLNSSIDFQLILSDWWKPDPQFFGGSPGEWLIIVLLIGMIVLSAIVIDRRRRIPTVRMSREQRDVLQRLIDKLIECATKSGQTDLVRHLKLMRIGGVMTEEFALQHDTNASTIVGQTITHFAPSFFERPICQQYQTLIHEASRVGGNYVEDTPATQKAYNQLLADEDNVYKTLAACLGCCHDFPRYARPPGCEAETDVIAHDEPLA